MTASSENGSSSRREFLKQNTIAGLGLAFAPDLTSLLANGAKEGETLFFDAYTRIDPRTNKHPEERWSLDHLVAEMDYCSISAALVLSTMSVTYDLMFSNLELCQRLKPYPHLFAVWNVMPHQTDEFPEPNQLGKQMKEHNVRAVSIYPKTNAWDWKAEHSRILLDWLAKNKVLTMVTVGEIGGWSELNQFLIQNPTLPVFLANATWTEQRYLLPLITRHKNLHICFDNFQINEGIEYLHEKGFTNQLVFGSKAPAMSAGAHRAYIDYSRIPQETKDKIAGGNLLRLLGGMQAPKLRINAEEDILMKAARQGKPLPTPVIDLHMHMLHDGLGSAGGHYRMRNGGPSGVFPLIKSLGYEGGGIMSWNGVVSGDAVAGNETTRQALDKAPKGYWGLATFDPTHYTQEQLEKMIPELYKDKRFIGMKPYGVYGVEYHHPSYDVWWKYGNENKLYALIHNFRSDLKEIETLAPKYPNVRWIIAHAGGSFPMADMAIAAMKKYPNIYAEITLTPVHLGIVEYLVKGAGENRILYGSDLPMRDPRQQLGWVVYSHLPLEVKKKILGGNATQIIEPCLERLPAYNRPASFEK